MAPTVLNWHEGMLFSLKDQLNKCKWGHLKQFGYGVVIVSFILHRVPHMRPQVAMSRLYAEDPSMLIRVYVMAHHGGRCNILDPPTSEEDATTAAIYPGNQPHEITMIKIEMH